MKLKQHKRKIEGIADYLNVFFLLVFIVKKILYFGHAKCFISLLSAFINLNKKCFISLLNIFNSSGSLTVFIPCHLRFLSLLP